MKRVHLMKTLFAASALAALSACSSIQQQDPQPKLPPQPQVKDRVAEVAESIDAQLRTLIRIEKGVKDDTRQASAKGSKSETKPYDVLDERVTIKWSGTAEGLVAGIAKKIDYEYVPSKVRPSVDTIVNMTVEDMPLRDVLREIGIRLDKTADIHVSKSKKTIAVIYK